MAICLGGGNMYLVGAMVAIILAIGSLYSIAKNPTKKKVHKVKCTTTRL